LLAALKDTDTRVRGYAADGLGGFPKAAALIVPALKRAARDQSAATRTRVMRSLGQLAFNADDRQQRQQVMGLVRPPLTAGLRDRNPETRVFALYGLGNLGPRAAPALRQIMRALKDPKWNVRAAAAQTLGKMESAATPAVGALIRALSDPASIGSKGEDPHVVRVNAMRALKQLRRTARGKLRRKIDVALARFQKRTGR